MPDVGIQFFCCSRVLNIRKICVAIWARVGGAGDAVQTLKISSRFYKNTTEDAITYFTGQWATLPPMKVGTKSLKPQPTFVKSL